MDTKKFGLNFDFKKGTILLLNVAAIVFLFFFGIVMILGFFPKLMMSIFLLLAGSILLTEVGIKKLLNVFVLRRLGMIQILTIIIGLINWIVGIAILFTSELSFEQFFLPFSGRLTLTAGVVGFILLADSIWLLIELITDIDFIK